MSNRPFVLSAACAALVLSGAASALAQDVALVVGNENYRNASDISAADDTGDAAETLADAGFAAVSGSDLTAADMTALSARFYGELAQAERVVILLAGHFVQAGKETWFLATDVDEPSLVDADSGGLPLDTILLMAAEKPGGAIVLLGTEDRRITLGRGLTRGIAALDIPPGVTVIRGDAGDIAEFASDVVALRGLSISQMLTRRGDLIAEGAVASFAPFRPSLTTVIGTEPALLPDPVEMARQTEAALNLSRDQRRRIQRDLTILDIDPRGIDGLFGPASRAAITVWQRKNSHDATGFVTGDQMAQLNAQAARRAAELEIEAARRQAEQDRLDRLYWTDTGSGSDEAGLRAYLTRYPDGLFADVAGRRLAEIETARRGTVDAFDRQTWDRALRLNTVAGFRNYLTKFPNGAFADDARAIIEERTADAGAEAARAAAEAEEASLNLNAIIRSLVERRLAALGLQPGPADGAFDDNTRRAIRRYQQARNLPVTGYLTRQTLVGLVAGAL